jgi:chitinase
MLNFPEQRCQLRALVPPPPPPYAGCSKGTDGKVKCHSDADYISAIQLLRAALPRPYILTTAAWSIGAYGEG